MDNKYRKQRQDQEDEAEKARHIIEEAFGNEKSNSNAPKAFVKGGIIDQNSRVSKDGQRGDLYVPSSGNRAKEDKKIVNAFEKVQSNRQAPAPQSYASTPKPRNIDKVAQEMKAKRQMLEMSQKAKQSEKPPQREPTREPSKFKGTNFSETLPQRKEVNKEKEFLETTEETNSIFNSLTNYHTHAFAEQSSASLVITNLPYNVEENELKDILGRYGSIDKFTLAGLKPNQDQPPRLVAFVKYKKESEAQVAKDTLKKTPIKGVAVVARWGQSHVNVKSIKDDQE